MFEKLYGMKPDGKTYGKLSADDVIELISSGRRDDLYDLNLVYKRMTNKNVMAIRLFSFMSVNEDNGVPERVVKYQFEFATFDEKQQKGSKQKDLIKLNMDPREFAYFCDILRGGRIDQLIEKNERAAAAESKRTGTRVNPKPAYDLFKEVGDEQRQLRIYRGTSKPVCIEASLKTKQGKDTKIYIGLDVPEAGMMGALGADAQSILNMWYAFGKADENLNILNARPEKAKPGSGAYRGQAAYAGGHASRGSDNGGRGNRDYAVNNSSYDRAGSRNDHYDDRRAYGQAW